MQRLTAVLATRVTLKLAVEVVDLQAVAADLVGLVDRAVVDPMVVAIDF